MLSQHFQIGTYTMVLAMLEMDAAHRMRCRLVTAL